ncbi:BrnT family toxin [Desulfovibrio piger]|uniref:BrnT family toxin n=1 Tax=Desulfovibrio piger TaxID=901 RepID=A0A848CL57_9BACT|nr:hypothetical protein [Desulfovibrio piger]
MQYEWDVSIHSRPVRRLTPRPTDRGRADRPSLKGGVTKKDFIGSTVLSTSLFPLKGEVSNHKGIFDEKKRTSNLEKHGEDFADVILLDWSRARIEPDIRHDYGEPRYAAFVPRDDDRLMCLVFTPRDRRMRIISYRKANSRERKKYETL